MYLPFPPDEHRRLHATKTLTTPEGGRVEIDTAMVPLIRAMWPQFRTLGSCQDIGKNRAILVMPKADGYRLFLALGSLAQPGQYDGWRDEDDPDNSEVIHISLSRGDIDRAARILEQRTATYGHPWELQH